MVADPNDPSPNISRIQNRANYMKDCMKRQDSQPYDSVPIVISTQLTHVCLTKNNFFLALNLEFEQSHHIYLLVCFIVEKLHKV